MRLTSILVLLALACGVVACKSGKRTRRSQAERPVASAGEPEAHPSGSAEQSAVGADDPANPPDSSEPADSEPASASTSSTAADVVPDTGGRRARAAFSMHAAGTVSQVQMRNVDFHVDDAVILRIKSLRGAIAGKGKSRPPAFDDKHSFVLRIDAGTVGISTTGLSEVMNNYVFGYPHAPIKKISITAEGDKIKLKGSVHKIVDIHFEISGGLTPTEDGRIRLHPSSIKADGVPVKRLMHLFGVELAKLIKPGQARGVEVNDDDLIIDPGLIIPAPEIHGRLTAVRIEGDQVIQQYGHDGKGGGPRPLVPYDRRAPNYIYFRGGTIRFGKLTMSNADMQIVDSHPKDPFDFSIDHYNRQLVAGYSKNTPRYGLVVFMPDYYQVK